MSENEVEIGHDIGGETVVSEQQTLAKQVDKKPKAVKAAP